jgi:hypothetical protein
MSLSENHPFDRLAHSACWPRADRNALHRGKDGKFSSAKPSSIARARANRSRAAATILQDAAHAPARNPLAAQTFHASKFQ